MPDCDKARELAEEALEVQTGEIRGPRGGRYVASGPMTVTMDDGDFVRDTFVFEARRPIRYVRPRRERAG